MSTAVAAARTPSPGGPRAPRRDGGRRGRRTLVLACLLATLAVAAVLSVTVGAKPVPLGDVWHGLTGPTGTENDIIVRSLRVPRTALGILAGVALGVAGALMQGHTRNPLADPGLLGVTQGAAFAMVASIIVLGVTDLYGYIWFGLAGALTASAGVFALGMAGGRGGPTPVTLALAGTAVSSFLYALTSALVLIDDQAMDVFRFWQAGSVAARGADVAWQVLPFIAAGLVMALANAPGLNALSLGEDVARALGRNVARTRALGVASVTLLSGAAVAACGSLAFVGLMVPHLVRPLSGPDHRWLLPYSGLAGAIALLVADVVGRVVARPGELEVGVVLALLGAPFFVALVRRRKPVRL
ncbi:iron ABC transporter permease [Planomonospora alba]|uniref:Iron ABC transporter permease n=1 Tax=Planomonospora alba TaxID=161354 RepID=A0ABP6MSQ2_9ACTN